MIPRRFENVVVVPLIFLVASCHTFGPANPPPAPRQPITAAQRAASQPYMGPCMALRDSVARAGGQRVYLFTELEYGAEVLDNGRYPHFDQTLGAGTVLGVYIVEPTGRVDARSFRVVRTNRPAHEKAVRAVLPSKTFRPAMLEGTPVRSCVQTGIPISVRQLALPDATSSARYVRQDLLRAA